MSSSKKSLAEFLKENTKNIPAAPAWEKQKIWRQIEAEMEGERSPLSRAVSVILQSVRGAPKWAAALGAAVVLIVGAGLIQHRQREERINRLLVHIVSGSSLIDADSDSSDQFTF